MEKHLLISKGCKGWGGPLTINISQAKKDCLYHRGDLSPGR
ncbi:type III effector Hop protein [Klebsiella oxytoca]|nr:type III effector Hop protein [Klebsiella oxytoca]